VFPVGIGLRDPRSQKRDLGHPSISPSILQRARALSFLSPVASASRLLGMTKERVGVSSGNWFEGSQVSKARPGAPFGFTLRCCRGHELCHFSPHSLQRVDSSG
jgi:hypothetical protein